MGLSHLRRTSLSEKLKLKRQLWPHSRVSGYLKKAAHFMADGHIAFVFCGFICFVLFFFCQFPQIDLSLSSMLWLTRKKIEAVYLVRAGALKEKRHVNSFFCNISIYIYFVISYKLIKIFYNQAMCSIMVPL